MIQTRMAVLVSLLAVPLGVLVVACGSGQPAVGDAKTPGATPGTALVHEDCSESGNKVETLDTNGDGKPDIRRVFNKGSGREICRIVDLNHDGKIDMYEYYDGSGNVRRREYCYDDSGQVNAIEYYDAGKLSKREYDTTGLHKIDTWDWFDTSAPTDAKTGRPVHPTRRERDVTGDGHTDQWWTWSGDNVSVAVDNDGDGKPDPTSTITLDKTGQPVDDSAPPPPPAPAASAASSAAPAASAAASAPAALGLTNPPPGSTGAPTVDGGH
jgi:hypothetical protein